MTCAAAFVEIRFQFNPSFPIVFDFQQRFPFRTQVPRERVQEPKRDKLNEIWLIAMWQITVLVPAEEHAINLFRGQWTRPCAFVPDQIAHARIEGRAGQSFRLHDGEEKCNAKMPTNV